MIRLESDDDRGAVRSVLTAAFATAAEARLVDELRAAGDLVLALVADEAGVIGHIAFSRLFPAEATLRAVALGPIGVLPAQQRRGIGSALVRGGLARLAEAGADLVVVFGDAPFYERFGFTRAAAARLETPYDGPHLLAKALSGPGARAHGRVDYAAAFAALG